MDFYQKSGFLLFSKSCCHKTSKYRLYFVYLPTMYTDTPRVHRLVCSRRKFYELEAGGVYNVTYSRIKLKTYFKTEDYPLSDEEYEALIDLRDYLFPDDDILDELTLSDDMPFYDKYYSLSEQKKILSYNPPKLERVSISVISYAVNVLSTLVPAALYMVFIYLYAGSLDITEEGTSPFLAFPLVLVLSLPFVIFLMNLMYTLGSSALYRISYTKWTLIKRHVIKYGGLKKNYLITRNEKKHLLSFGVISLLLFILSLVLAQVLF